MNAQTLSVTPCPIWISVWVVFSCKTYPWNPPPAKALHGDGTHKIMSCLCRYLKCSFQMVPTSYSATDKVNARGGFEFICQSLQSTVGALCKELNKVTISNLFLRSSQPAPGTCEISPEANPTVPNLGTGLDWISGEAAVWVLCRGVTAQETGWGCLRSWGYPAVPAEGAVPSGKVWLTCLRLHGALAQLLCWLRVISVTLLLCQCSMRLKIEELQSWYSLLFKEQLI